MMSAMVAWPAPRLKWRLLNDAAPRDAEALFGERTSAILVATAPEVATQLVAEGANLLGTFEGDKVLGLQLSDLRAAHEDWLPTYMNKVD